MRLGHTAEKGVGVLLEHGARFLAPSPSCLDKPMRWCHNSYILKAWSQMSGSDDQSPCLLALWLWLLILSESPFFCLYDAGNSSTHFTGLLCGLNESMTSVSLVPDPWKGPVAVCCRHVPHYPLQIGKPRLREDKWLAQGYLSRASHYDHSPTLTRPFRLRANPTQKMTYELLLTRSIHL